MSEQSNVGESQGLSVSQLLELARQGYEQKRTKNCLDLTRAILLIDPENTEAQLMRSSIRSEMHRDLENARAIVRDAPFNEKPEIYLQPDDLPSRTAIDESREPETTHPLVLEASPQALADDSIVIPPLPTLQASSQRPKATSRSKQLKRAAGALVFLGLVVAAWPLFRSKSNPVQVPVSLAASAGAASLDARKDTPQVDSLPSAVSSVDLDSLIADSRLIVPAPATLPVVVTPRPSAVPTPREEPVAPARDGTLAISSPAAADLYIDDEYVGSTPLSVPMSAGTHTVEYRHGALRKTVTYVIKENETTRAMITFDVAVSINANPWADVFLDGIEKKALGQTPLSGVRVPIGGVLLFQNPKFQSKKYRVTGNETGIQVTFQ